VQAGTGLLVAAIGAALLVLRPAALPQAHLSAREEPEPVTGEAAGYWDARPVEEAA